MTLAPVASPLITGGAFGPEASLVAEAVCLGLGLGPGLAFILAAWRGGHWRGPSFRMMLD